MKIFFIVTLSLSGHLAFAAEPSIVEKQFYAQANAAEEFGKVNTDLVKQRILAVESHIDQFIDQNLKLLFGDKLIAIDPSPKGFIYVSESHEHVAGKPDDASMNRGKFLQLKDGRVCSLVLDVSLGVVDYDRVYVQKIVAGPGASCYQNNHKIDLSDFLQTLPPNRFTDSSRNHVVLFSR